MIFYGLGLNTGKFFDALGFVTRLEVGLGGPTACQLSNTLDPATAGGIFRDFKNLIAANMLLSAVGLVPGYWATFLLVEKLGRKRIQMFGFVILTVLFAIMG